MFYCTKCDTQYDKWQGRCFECGNWSTVVEGEGVKGDTKKTKSKNTKTQSVSISHSGIVPEIIKAKKNAFRLLSGWEEFDEVLGGGLVKGGVVLLAGEPGTGKSTLALQICKNIKESILYITGEESIDQVADRAERLGLAGAKNITIASAQNLADIADLIKKLEPKLLVIDSIQTISDDNVEGVIGSVSQVKAVTAQLVSISKENEIPCLIVGHVNKDGAIAGPKTLEHTVDVVCYFEADRTDGYRLLKVQKNRYGSTNGVAVWKMTTKGLESVKSVETVFLPPAPSKTSRVIGVMLEGLRPFLVEVQALITTSSFPYPERNVNGFDANRLKMIIAVVQRYADINLQTDDIFVNVVGGWKVNDTGLDAAIALAIIMAKRTSKNKSNKPYFAIGELGLDGSARAVQGMEARIKAAKTLDYELCLAPFADDKKITNINSISGLVSTISQ